MWTDRRLALPPDEGRWVIVDVETSGLNPLQDSLIAIGALGVTDAAIDFADSFEVVLRQERPSGPANIEVHGIGAREQMEGEDPASGLARFLDFIGRDPLVAYHAPFDVLVLGRALRAHLATSLRSRWLDLAHVAPLAWPGRAGPSLDAWLEAFAIPVADRHRAIVDCLATAQLFLALLHEAPRLAAKSAGGLLRLSAAGRWLR